MKRNALLIFLLGLVVLLTACNSNIFKDKFDKCVYNDDCTTYEKYNFKETETNYEKYLKQNTSSELDGILLEYNQYSNREHSINLTIETEEDFSSESYLSYEKIHDEISLASKQHYHDLLESSSIEVELTVIYNDVEVHFDWIQYTVDVSMIYSGDMRNDLLLYSSELSNMLENEGRKYFYFTIYDEEQNVLIYYILEDNNCRVQSIVLPETETNTIQEVKDLFNEMYVDMIVEFSID